MFEPFSQVNDSEDAEGREEERNWKIELILFSWVIIVINPVRFEFVLIADLFFLILFKVS